MERLEHEADLLATQPRELIFAERRDVGLVDDNRPAGWCVETGDQPEQRRFAASRRTDDGQALSRRHRQIDRMKNREQVVAALDCFGNAAQLDHFVDHRLHRPARDDRRCGRRRRWWDGCHRIGSRSGTPATPSSRNGTNVTLFSRARS